MLRTLLTQLRLTSGRVQEQLELAFGRGVTPAPPSSLPPSPSPPAAAPAARADALLARLQALGLRGITTLRLTRNRATMVSFRGTTMRVHEAFADAPDEVQRALVAFVCGRGAARAAAKRAILALPIVREPSAPQRRRAPQHPDDALLAARLTKEHARLNAAHFGGTLRPVDVRVSRRMKTRLGHYAPAGSAGVPDIVISRRHLKRHGWQEAVETLLHEMVHQWQEEHGHPLDHGPLFRRKAREVGVAPRARRALR